VFDKEKILEVRKMSKVYKVGFIGTGVMGKSMASHLQHQGHELFVYTRTKEKAQSLIDEGAVWCSIKEIAETCDVVMTMVGYPSDVEEVYFSEQGLLNNAKAGTYLIDFTTSTPSLAQKIYRSAKEKEIYTLDAPVSGGDVGARNATLTIMVGGDEDVFDTCSPMLKALGENVLLQGQAGAGQHTKMCNQIAIASNMLGICEAVAYAKKAGLDQENVLKSISAGAAGSWSLSNLAPRIINGDFEPGFFVKHFIKDLKIALDEAEKMNFKMHGVEMAKEMYEKLAQQGFENKGTQVLYKWYE
jgi:3-hydroxyisobutyrate dehydrogenase